MWIILPLYTVLPLHLSLMIIMLQSKKWSESRINLLPEYYWTCATSIKIIHSHNTNIWSRYLFSVFFTNLFLSASNWTLEKKNLRPNFKDAWTHGVKSFKIVYKSNNVRKKFCRPAWNPSRKFWLISNFNRCYRLFFQHLAFHWLLVFFKQPPIQLWIINNSYLYFFSSFP